MLDPLSRVCYYIIVRRENKKSKPPEREEKKMLYTYYEFTQYPEMASSISGITAYKAIGGGYQTVAGKWARVRFLLVTEDDEDFVLNESGEGAWLRGFWGADSMAARLATEGRKIRRIIWGLI